MIIMKSLGMVTCMNIISTIVPKEEIQNELRKRFPKVQAEFFNGMKEAEEHLHKAEIFITYGEDLTEERLKKAENLKWIMVMSAGLEKMPFQFLMKRKIKVTNARGIHKIPMAEYTIGVMLNHSKRLGKMLKNQMAKNWDKKLHMQELYGKTLLIVGAGAIGQQIAVYAHALGMNVLGINTSGKNKPPFKTMHKLEQLKLVLPEADYVVSVLPSTKQTKGIFNKELFSSFKPGSVFINIGRGDAVIEQDLIEILNDGIIDHAYLDVFQQEPLPCDHPFWTMENVTITPHVSSHSKMYLVRAFDIFYKNLETYLNNGDDFINEVDLTRGY